MKGLKHIISKDLYRKARAPIFVLIIFLMATALIYIYLQRTQGGEVYTYTNTNGIKVISNTPISEKHERKASGKGFFNTMTPPDREMLENGNKAQQQQYKNEREKRGKLLLLYSIFR